MMGGAQEKRFTKNMSIVSKALCTGSKMLGSRSRS
jgi:hypothetical protein